MVSSDGGDLTFSKSTVPVSEKNYFLFLSSQLISSQPQIRVAFVQSSVPFLKQWFTLHKDFFNRQSNSAGQKQKPNTLL
jgi:hypothetical protein